MKRVLTGTLTGALTLAASGVALAPGAAAWDHQNMLTCDSFVVDYVDFETENNRFVLSIDDEVVYDQTFDEGLQDVVSFDNTVPHEIVAELFVDGVGVDEEFSETTPCENRVDVRPELPQRATSCTDPLAQISLPTTEGVSYSVRENDGELVAVAEDPYVFEEDADLFDEGWFGSLPGQRLAIDLGYLMPEDCDDQVRVTAVSAVCDAGTPYVEYALQAPWASSVEISFAPEDVSADTFPNTGAMRGQMPFEGRTPWPGWVPQDDPYGGPDVEFLPPEEPTLWDGHRIDVHLTAVTMSPGYMAGGQYVDSALEYPCGDDTGAAPGAGSGDGTAAEGDTPVLAATGATVGGAAAFAALLVAAGGVFLWLRRRALAG